MNRRLRLEQLERRDSDVLREVISRCCRLKADVVEADERELTGQRAVLNYGHTFAHALEAVPVDLMIGGEDDTLPGDGSITFMSCGNIHFR